MGSKKTVKKITKKQLPCDFEDSGVLINFWIAPHLVGKCTIIPGDPSRSPKIAGLLRVDDVPFQTGDVQIPAVHFPGCIGDDGGLQNPWS